MSRPARAEAEPAPVFPNRSRGSAFSIVAVLGWAAATIAEIALGLRGWVSAGFTAFEVLAMPVFTVAVLRIGKRELAARTDDIDGDARKLRHRALWIRTWGVHVVIVLLLLGCLAGQCQIIYASLEQPGDGALWEPSYRSYVVAAFLLVVVGLLGSPRRIATLMATVADRPARLMAGSFGLAALIGGLLLALPVSLNRFEDASLVNALFNSVSAVCVTGLAVSNVAETYTPFGQAVLFVLFQIGGLGIMSLSTFFAVVAGQRLHARRAKAMAELLDVDSFSTLRHSLIAIVLITFVVEAIGAVSIYASLGDHPAVALTALESDASVAGPGARWWAALFHAVSAFCNAGFSNFRDGLFPFADSFLMSGTLSLLIVMGGLGFPVTFELMRRALKWVRRERRKRMSLHTRVVLFTSCLLWLGGAVLFLLLEAEGALAALSWPHKAMAALFQSVTCRTAGFSTVDFGVMGPATWMLACALMFVGASPGSTGGGAKTTTLATLFATLRAELRRAPQATLAGRAVPSTTIRRAIAVTFINVIVVGIVLFVLLVTESHDPAKIGFEVVSAVSTAGLSTGITGELSVAGKTIVLVGMFVGRIGPLTAALAVGDRDVSTRHRLVEERIAIG